MSLDIYLNETTRHAHLILPGLSPLESSHYDLALWQLAIRNYANYSPPVFAPPTDRPTDWETVLRLVGIVMGQGPNADTAALDDFIALQQLESAAGAAGSPVQGREAGELLAALVPRRGPERLLDILLRTGPYGDGFGVRPDGLSLDALQRAPHGVDLGPLAPRIPEVLRTPSGKIELAPPEITADVPRLRSRLSRPEDELTLVGRRDLRSNNSWMHNIETLVKGKPRCTLWVHPDDAASSRPRRRRRGAGPLARGSPRGPRRGDRRDHAWVVSVPHGWDTTRRARRAARGLGARQREQQPPRRRAGDGPAVGQRGAERHPGHGRAGSLTRARVALPASHGLAPWWPFPGRLDRRRVSVCWRSPSPPTAAARSRSSAS